MAVEIAALSSRGGRPLNEDTCGWWTGRDLAFCVVSDGAGGHRGGEIASKLVVEETLGYLRSTQDCTVHGVEAALRYAHERLVSEQCRDTSVADMRATVVVLAIDSARQASAWGHLGDSRLYCFRENRLAFQTRDHSMVQALIDAGLLNSQEARTSPQRNKLLNAMGHDGDFEPRVDGSSFVLRADDKFLLCTDGLWGLVEEREMESALHGCASAEDWLRVLESFVLERASGKHDNYSALAVWCRPASGLEDY
jgi:serine/threonine protein phosphatase PrpC